MISVAMITYNGIDHLPAQVTSILSQLSAIDELVVSDDGSSDGTWEWLSDLAAQDTRIRLFRNAGQPGIISNFNHALRHCRGELVFLSDQDDLWYPEKVASLSRELSSLETVWLVQSDAQVIDNLDQVIAPSIFALRKSRPGIWKNFWRNTYQGCTIAFRRELLELALPLPARLPMHDMWLGILAEIAGQVRFIPERLTGYRRHGENSSAMTPSSAGQVLVWRINLGLALLGRCIRRFRTILKLRRIAHES